MLSLKKSAAIVAASLLTTTALACETALEINHAWARATAPGTTKGGAYLYITNTSKHADRLLSFTSSAASTHEIHEHVHKDGMMMMQEIADGVVIPPGETAIFKPMGNHLMFIDLDDTLVAGESFTVTLTFEQKGDVEVTFPILSPEEAQNMLELTPPKGMDMEKPEMHHEHMDHSKMDHSKMDHG